MTDLSTVPLVALSSPTKEVISSLLNPTKFIPTDDGLPRDWRGLAHLSGIGGQSIPNLAKQPDPCAVILNNMQKKAQDWTIANFLTLLETLDRWDIIDDTQILIEKDAENYAERSARSSGEAEKIDVDVDKDILTIDDLYRKHEGKEIQYYDAFLLYADEDADFASEIVENLEKKSDLRLCIKDRDLIGGITFEHDAVMRLIAERCNRLIVVVSPHFLKSSANKFFLNFAQALGIDKRQRKVIPCLYQRCQLPPELSYYFILDYNRAGKLWDFWGKLRDSVKGTQSPRAVSMAQSLTPQIVEATAINRQSPIPTEKKRSEDPCHKSPRAKKKCSKPYPKPESNARAINSPVNDNECLSPVQNPACQTVLPCPDIQKRKKNLMDKCVNKVRSLLRS